VKGIRRFIQLAIKEYGMYVEDCLPIDIQQKYKLLSKREAVEILHFPLSTQQMKYARRRMVYEEFLLFQLKIQLLRKNHRENIQGVQKKYSEQKVMSFIDNLPFQLTKAQEKVVREIISDLCLPYRMNRLLQGDVGSGKTVVATIGLYANFLSSFQGALMVPTEILAEQHFQSLKKLLEPFSVRVELLTSSVKGKRRKEILSQLELGDIHVIVGTHSLIQDEVNFSQLGCIIIDE